MDQTSVTATPTKWRVRRGIDISFNAISFPVVQGVPWSRCSSRFHGPGEAAARTHFITATTAARHMTTQGRA